MGSEWRLAAGKVTVGLASLWLRVTDISGSPPTGSRPREGRWAPAYALFVEYGEVYLYLLPSDPLGASGKNLVEQ